MSDPAGENIELNIDEASIQQSVMRVRSLMFEINSVKNLATDVQRMAAEPSLSNFFWMGMQVQMTAQRLKSLPGTISGAEAGVQALGALILTPEGAAAAIAITAAAVVGSLVLSDLEKRRNFDEWTKAQYLLAKEQGMAN